MSAPHNSATHCECGAARSTDESTGTGDYVDDDGLDAWICLACWCVENYGAGTPEALDAKINAKQNPGTPASHLLGKAGP